MFKKIVYKDLNSRQQENYNFHKVAARMADYGFNAIKLSDDWQGADFIAVHIGGELFLKVQLKGRFTVQKKYCGRGIHVAFPHNGAWYVYPHDEIMNKLISLGRLSGTSSWENDGSYTWPSLPKSIENMLAPYLL